MRSNLVLFVFLIQYFITYLVHIFACSNNKEMKNVEQEVDDDTNCN